MHEMKKQFTRFILTIAMIIAMIPAVSLPAYAANSASPAVIDVGDDSGTNLPAGVTYTSGGGIGVFTVSTNGSITVTGTTNVNTIVVTNSAIVTLTLSGASITAPVGSTYSPIDLQGSSNVTLQLAGGTTSTASAINAAYRAGVHAPAGTALTINGTGSLIATGNSTFWGAGIGGGSDSISGEDGGTITVIGGAHVTAVGGRDGAGIGGCGTVSGGHGTGGTITIGGSATVNATGGIDGAGIGGGNGAGGTITIGGSATVNATGGASGAGVGGGSSAGAGGNISINGGTVTATAGSGSAAGIGGGNAGGGGTIVISGGIVTATGDWFGAGIGGGVSGAGGNINIDGGTVTAIGGGAGGAGIGGGEVGTGGNITISGIAFVMSVASGSGNPAIHAASGSGSVINAKLDNAISAGSDTYLKCNGNSLKLPANYKDFAFSAAAASPINAWSDPACSSIIAGIVTIPGGIANIPLSATIATAPTSVTIASTYTLTVNLNGGNGSTASGSYASGAAVAIDAGTKSGYTFSNWTNSNGGTFTNAVSAATTFTMPGNATTITAIWTQNSSGGGGGGSHTQPGTNITIDDEKYTIGDENEDGTDTTVTIDQNKFDDGIEKASDHSGVIIPVSGNANVTARLVVKNIEDMAKKDMTLTVQTGNVAYNLNTTAIDTAKITAALGMTDTSKIPFDVKIANSNAVVNGTTVVLSPVEFTITAVYNGKTVNVDKFSSFVDRTIEITADQAKKITTAVVVEANGSLRHVPTKVTVIDGKYYAVINSLTNSTYSVVWHPVEFSDVATHWAKETINDMGSRMVISGVGQGNFEPDRDIARAEFAAIIVRALGLAPGNGMNSFTDVNTSDWYCGYVKTAAEYGIITGYDAATFGPSDKITREQAMTMIARAMKITGLKSEMKDSEISALIANYSDGTAASDYAKTNIAACLKTGMVTGRTSDTIAPKNCITRAEVAVIVQRLLRKSDLI